MTIVMKFNEAEAIASLGGLRLRDVATVDVRKENALLLPAALAARDADGKREDEPEDWTVLDPAELDDTMRENADIDPAIGNGSAAGSGARSGRRHRRPPAADDPMDDSIL